MPPSRRTTRAAESSAPEPSHIRIRGAREHNLQGIDVDIPRNKLTVVCGVSGSGKSSLAFDTVFAEGQRRYVESLSTYARQFLGQMHKPEVDSIDGLSPAVAIDQKTRSSNPRSTVGTVTEIYDYLRVLYARCGTAFCPKDGAPLGLSSPSQVASRALREWPAQSKVTVLAPVVRGRKGSFTDQLSEAADAGFARVFIDGSVHSLPYEGPELDKRRRHEISVVVDRVVLKGEDSTLGRLVSSLETALSYAGDVAYLELSEAPGEGPLASTSSDITRLTVSTGFACPVCTEGFFPLEPRSFSFNSPYGACASCDGLGEVFVGDKDLVVPNPSLSLEEGAIAPWTAIAGQYQRFALSRMAQAEGIDMSVPFESLTHEQQSKVLDGTDTPYQTRWQGSSFTVRYEGPLAWLAARRQNAESAGRVEAVEQYMRPVPCGACKGARLAPMPSSVTFNGRTLPQLCALTVADLALWFSPLKDASYGDPVAGPLAKEVAQRLSFLVDVGLEYLSLDRSAQSLSGGEAQRIRLASQVGSALAGVLYVLDEPSIGLHPQDNLRLIATLHRLRDLGNTVLVVEHDEETITASDYVVEIGPQAGVDGGRLVYAGAPAGIVSSRKSPTGQFLSGRAEVTTPQSRRSPRSWLELDKVSVHNVKDLDARFPLGCLTVVAGPSGSGKSSLVVDTLYPLLASRLQGARTASLKVGSVRGIEELDRVVSVDQAPIGRTPRSNAATYTGVFDKIRTLFSTIPAARAQGYAPGRFSFNVAGGRCEACRGEGELKVEMHFLPDVFVQCEQCGGTRFNDQTLKVRFKGKSIADVLAMPASEALEFFKAHPPIARQLQTLVDVGLGYLPLGHPATQLSGGEAQRVKLASELQRRVHPTTLYVLDEPTTGLHFADVSKLVAVLHRLTDQGATVVVIEHNLDVLRQADWVIDMGPAGGPAGGRVVSEGTPEEVARSSSPTASFIADALGKHPARSVAAEG